MKKYYCDLCRKEIVNEEHINTMDIYYNRNVNPDKYELCPKCYRDIKQEIPKIFNWRNKLR